MKMVCPHCQADFDMLLGIQDLAARQAVQRAFSLTPLGDVLIQYVQLFKPAKQALKMTMLVRILDELLPHIQAGKINAGGGVQAAPHDYWRSAIETMLASRDKLTLPLKSHGYLFQIIAGMGNKAAAAAEKQQEQGRKYGAIQTANQTNNHFRDNAKMGGDQLAQNGKPARKAMPAEVQKTLNKLTGKTMEKQNGH